MTPIVFVFGSNLAGIHGAGSALEAVKTYGAIRGVGEGRQGHAYAIPTKDKQIRTLPLVKIAEAVTRFLAHAADHPDEQFNVVRIGCGLAGLTDAQVAPLFAGAPTNVWLPDGWREMAQGA